MKRILDIFVSTVGLFLLAPFFAVIGVLVKVTSPGPVFFRQERVGQHGRTFRIYKFRTMEDGAHKRGSHVTSRKDNRITRVGGFLRRHKLDEFPQLINVLQGDMSLVGPRPEVPRYVKEYPQDFAQLFARKPGMTHRVSLMLRHEEEILARSADPEQLYINSVLPWKLGLYLNEGGASSIGDDIATIYRTIFSRDEDLRSQVPYFDCPVVANIPAHPVLEKRAPSTAMGADLEAPLSRQASE